MQELVKLSNLLLYKVLSKFSFRFCPPSVHEIKILFSWGQLTCKVISDGGQGDSGNDTGTDVCCESPYVAVLKHH